MSAPLDHRAPPDPALHDRLRSWVDASLISAAEADAIEAFEAAEAEVPPRRLPLLTEALAYVGLALAAAAAAVLLGDRWEELTPAARATSVGAGAVTAFVAGWVLRGSAEPGMARITSVLWGAATGLTGLLAWLVAYDVLDHRGSVPALATGVAMATVGGALYVVHRRSLQQIAMFAGLLTIAGASFSPVGDGTPSIVAVWAVAVVWTILGAVGLLQPRIAALAAGPIVALWAPLTFEGSEVGMWLALATGIGLVVAGVARHESVLLGLGAFGLFASVIRVLVRFFGDTAGMPIALLGAGVVVLVLAVTFARRSGRAATRSAPRSPS